MISVWRAIAGGGLAVALALVPGVAAAQGSQYLGRAVADVRLTIHGQPANEAELRQAVETEVGQPLTMAQVRESIVHLMALGRFENVRVDVQAASGGGATVAFDLVPVHVVRDLVFHGALGLPSSMVRGQIVDRYGASPPLGRTDDMVSNLLDLYHEHGYRNATVTASPRLDPDRDTATLAFEVDAGPQVRIAHLTIDGDKLIDRDTLLRRLELKDGGPYDDVAARSRASAYTESLHSDGYYEALVEPVPRYAVDGLTLDLSVTANRGPLVTVEIRGETLSRQKRDALVPVARDKTVDTDLLDDWAANLARDLQAQGYKDAATRMETQDRAGTRHYVFDVTRGRLYRVGAVTFAGNTALAEDELLKLLGIQPGQPLVQTAVDAGRARIEERYKREGFEDARAQVQQQSRATTAAEVQVDLAVQVTEGVQALIHQVRFTGNAHVPAADLAALVTEGSGKDARTLAQALAPGRPFYVPEIEQATAPIRNEYLDRGYLNVNVSVEAPVNPNHSRDVTFVIREGPQFLVDHILISGNTRTRAETIKAALQLRPGQPLSESQLQNARVRLTDLGLFRRVEVSPLQHGTEDRRDVLVIVQEAEATALAWGGGLEGGNRQIVGVNGNAVQSFELAPRGLVEIGRRNLWGKNRSIDFIGSLAVRPESGGLFGTGLTEYRALGTYREPHLLDLSADLLVSGGVEQAVRPAYSFNRRSIRAELVHRLSTTVSLSGRYSLERTRVFLSELISEPDQILVGRILPRVRLSKVASSLVRDTRKDAADPDGGALVSVEGEIAPQFLGSQYGVARTLLQGFVYRRLPGPRRIVFAGGLRIGFATGFGTGPELDAQGNEVLENGNPIIVPITQPPLSERFFAGGNTTVRGVSEDSLGTPDTLTTTGFATGGSSLLIANAELRFSIWKSLSLVTFADAGNVFARASEMRVSNLQPAVGFGVRYNSPFGPIRVDLGFNLKRRTLGGTREGLKAIYFGIGHAF